MIIRLTLLAGCCVAGLALPGCAQAPATQPGAEAAAAPQQRFRERFFRQYDTDRDGNGSLSRAEYVAEYEGRLRADYGSRPLDDAFRHAIEQTHRRFRAIDRNRDEAISRAEYDAVAARTFTQADTDGNGSVTAADRVAHPTPQPRGN